MDEHRPASASDVDGLDPSIPGQLDECDRLKHCLGRLAQKSCVGRGSSPSSRTSHTLHERRYGRGCVCLKHVVEIANVDPQLECRSADDARVRLLMKALLGG